MGTFHRYVAIGDSATEGLEDPDPRGGYRGWADRLAMILSAHAQAEGATDPVLYANLALRGQIVSEVRTLQFDQALAMAPDLLTITGGVNDCLGLNPDFDAIRQHLAVMFSEARGAGMTVMTLGMPDPTTINPLGGRLARDRILRLNQVLRTECERYEVLLLDLEQFPGAADPRLWFEDRLHGNALGHERVARGMAWLLGLPGFDDWAEPLPDDLDEDIARERAEHTGDLPAPAPGPFPLHSERLGHLALEAQEWRERVAGDWEWARRHFGPWLSRGIRGIRHDQGLVAKRPELTPVELADEFSERDES